MQISQISFLTCNGSFGVGDQKMTFILVFFGKILLRQLAAVPFFTGKREIRRGQVSF